MTCIVGLKTESEIIIGGDHAINDGERIHLMLQPKVFKKGQFTIGYCGSLRVGQVIQYGLKIPPGFRKKDLHEYMVINFANSMRNCLNLAGPLKTEGDVQQENRFLISFLGRLFEIDESYSVTEVSDGMIAIGSGVEFALGSLHATKDDKDSYGRVKKALEAAAYYSQTVSAPFTIHKINLKKGSKSEQGKKKKLKNESANKEQDNSKEGVDGVEDRAEGHVEED
tara:strand:+ start:92346 stop:93020 length:675 start_codon:yes stop_codon:yes gene_type:complete